MIKRSHIRKFLAVVEAESFTQAASRIHVTQPTLSVGIADLERIVGDKLFSRDKRRARLTESGRRFLPIARELEANFRKADRFSQRAGKRWPDLRIGMIRSVAGRIAQEIGRRLSQSYSIELVDGSDAELRAQLANEQFDAIVTVLRTGDSAERSLALFTESYAMFVADTHPLASVEAVEPEELADEVMIARRSCEILGDTSKFFTRHGVRPNFALKSDNDERCMHMVAASVGITTAPMSLQIEGTVPIAVKGYDFSRRIGLLLPSPAPASGFGLEEAMALFAGAFTD